MAKRPDQPQAESAAAHDLTDYAARNGWDRPYETYDDFDLPT